MTNKFKLDHGVGILVIGVYSEDSVGCIKVLGEAQKLLLEGQPLTSIQSK